MWIVKNDERNSRCNNDMKLSSEKERREKSKKQSREGKEEDQIYIRDGREVKGESGWKSDMK